MGVSAVHGAEKSWAAWVTQGRRQELGCQLFCMWWEWRCAGLAEQQGRVQRGTSYAVSSSWDCNSCFMWLPRTVVDMACGPWLPRSWTAVLKNINAFISSNSPKALHISNMSGVERDIKYFYFWVYKCFDDRDFIISPPTHQNVSINIFIHI